MAGNWCKVQVTINVIYLTERGFGLSIRDITCVSLGISMPCWYFEKTELKNTPSIIDGISCVAEARYRREGVKLIVEAGVALGLYHFLDITVVASCGLLKLLSSTVCAILVLEGSFYTAVTTQLLWCLVLVPYTELVTVLHKWLVV